MPTAPRRRRAQRIRTLIRKPGPMLAVAFAIGIPAMAAGLTHQENRERAEVRQLADRTSVDCSDHALTVATAGRHRTVFRHAITGVAEQNDPRRVSVTVAGGEPLVLDFPTAANAAAVRRCASPAPA